QRVAVLRRSRNALGRDVSRSAWPVLDHERLFQLSTQGIADQPRRQVGEATGRHADDDFHRLARVGILSERPAAKNLDSQGAQDNRSPEPANGGGVSHRILPVPLLPSVQPTLACVLSGLARSDLNECRRSMMMMNVDAKWRSGECQS